MGQRLISSSLPYPSLPLPFSGWPFLPGLSAQERPTELFRNHCCSGVCSSLCLFPRVMEGDVLYVWGALGSSPDFACVFAQVVAGCGNGDSH